MTSLQEVHFITLICQLKIFNKSSDPWQPYIFYRDFPQDIVTSASSLSKDTLKLICKSVKAMAM